jgi:hypothetical protein
MEAKKKKPNLSLWTLSSFSLRNKFLAEQNFEPLAKQFVMKRNETLCPTGNAKHLYHKNKQNKTNSMVWVRERTIPSDRRLSAKWLPTFADRGCHVVSFTDPYGSILGFLDRSRYFSIKKPLSCTHETECTPLSQTHYCFFFFPQKIW